MQHSRKVSSRHGRRGVTFTFEEGPPITGVSGFLEQIRSFTGPGNQRIYFRGHNQPTSDLLPSIGRSQFYLGQSICFTQEAETQLLQQFRRYAYSHFGRIPTEWETLFLARHYGLPTRLLDWTSNPLVALYFAAFYDNETPYVPPDRSNSVPAKLELHGAVWAMEPRKDLLELDVFSEKRKPLDIPGIKLVFPFNPTPRMTAQAGIFTLHGNPRTDVVQCAGTRFKPADLDIAKLVRWKVESQCKTRIILELERLSVNSRTLFPDLEGLAKGLWQTEIIRTCFSR